MNNSVDVPLMMQSWIISLIDKRRYWASVLSAWTMSSFSVGLTLVSQLDYGQRGDLFG